MIPRETLARFDGYLAGLGLKLDAVVVGGAALALLGIVGRPTRDVDIVEPELPEEILDAARSFARLIRAEGDDLQDEWLNNGPAPLADVLPDGWRDRTHVVFVGQVVTLAEIGPWLEKQDEHPEWPQHVRTTLLDLQVRLGHGV